VWEKTMCTVPLPMGTWVFSCMGKSTGQSFNTHRSTHAIAYQALSELAVVTTFFTASTNAASEAVILTSHQSALI
jgi:hypothetical protein